MKKENNQQPLVSIIMGSKSDWAIMQQACEMLTEFEIPFETDIVSAHRTPEKMLEFAQSVANRSVQVIVAGAGGAAHLPGMTASLTTLPVIGVPIKSSNSIDGWDSILSILQMPSGIPVATVALDGAKNAGLLAARIIGSTDKTVENKLINYQKELKEKVLNDAKDFSS